MNTGSNGAAIVSSSLSETSEVSNVDWRVLRADVNAAARTFVS